MKELFIALSYLCYSLLLQAQETTNISYLDIERGLSNNQVRSIVQDHNGFMWFATKDGLNRYDGYTFDVFRKKVGDSCSLVHDILTAITPGDKHQVWAATRQGVSVYNDTAGSFRTIKYRPYNSNQSLPLQEVIRSVRADRRGNMLIASEGLGLLYTSKGNTTAVQIPLKIDKKVNLTYGVPCLTITPRGEVWVFVQKIGLCRLRYESMTLELINNDTKLAVSMEADSQHIYIGGYQGLSKFGLADQKMENVLLSPAHHGVLTINALTWRAPTELWIGTAEDGLFTYHTKEAQATAFLLPNKKNLADYGYIYALFKDRDNRIWIGTSISGLLIVDPNKKNFQTIAPTTQTANDKSGRFAISAFREDKQHHLYVGTENAGLYVWRADKGFYRHFQHQENKPGSLSSNSITAILQDHRQSTWIATFNAGINKYNSTSGSFERYRCINPLSGTENKVIRHLYQDKNHQLWATALRQGTLMGGLYRFDYQLDKFILFDDRLSDFFAITEDRAGKLWGGSLTQLVAIDTIEKKHRFFPINYTVTSIYEDRLGHFWIGTEGGGLFQFDREKFILTKHYTTENGLCNNAVLSILEDRDGFLWMSTYNGLMKFNPKNEKFLYYYQSDGLQGNQFQLCAATELSSGAFVFGGIKGFNLFFPSEINLSKTSPPLYFTNVSVDGQAHPFRENELVLPYSKTALTFQFAALEYSAPDKIQYAYFMEGWDKHWNEAGNNRTINYNRMAEGSYILRIRNTNSEGIWMQGDTQLRITILPPWYRTWWAYLLYGLLLLVLLYSYVRYRTKQTRLQYEVKVSKFDALRKKAEYDAEVVRHEKDLIAFEQERLINEKEKELNEKRISFFTNISHEFRTPLTLIINPVKELLSRIRENEARNELHIMHRSARRMLNLVDQLLLFRKLEAGYDQLHSGYFNFYNLCEEVYLYFIHQAQAKQITYDFICSNKELHIIGDREKLEMVLFNLISNALKYTPSRGSVALRVVECSQELIIEVSDTGCGISAREGDKLFERFYQVDSENSPGKLGFGIGLYLAKQFVGLHGGQLSYTSILGEGTTFKVVLLKQEDQLMASFLDKDAHSSPPLEDNSLIPETLVDPGADLKEELISDKRSLLIVDDDIDIRTYIKNIFKATYNIYEAEDGEEGLEMVRKKSPDLIITDYKMGGLDGISFCQQLKNDATFSNIPIILLTASTSKEVQLKSLDSGADDFLTKPFERDYLVARVANLLQNRNYLQNYFYNEITLQSNTVIVSHEYKKFLGRCIEIVEQHLSDTDFGIQVLAAEIGMSHSNLYKRVKAVSGQSVSAFIRYIRLRKAAQLLIDTDCNVTEAAFQAGFNDPKYFSKQFTKLFHSSPSDFIKKHRNAFGKYFKVQKEEGHGNK
ncbi:two-component regulator propeller domain-containing protein [Olivibacter domesticus]|uniref:histidine kinase n=1 Tax=Olivibacter domesticus TaxID=407022 RepID=A0A1H7GHH5_OLID1|nr:two-component regulator propeller domain-containing protein [Olivibacter domesticus]SEK36382.1 Signal transduction histidine kinase [Olivibacter domesticus]